MRVSLPSLAIRVGLQGQGFSGYWVSSSMVLCISLYGGSLSSSVLMHLPILLGDKVQGLFRLLLVGDSFCAVDA